MSQIINDKVTINNSYTRLNTKGKYCDKDILIVLEDAKNLIPSNIKEGVTIAGVMGTLKPETSTECECYVESIDKTIDEIDVSLYNEGKIIYSTTDKKVYQKQDSDWVHLDAPIVPIVEDVTTESVEGYSDGNKVYDEKTESFYILSNGEWKKLKLPNLLEDYSYIVPTHNNQNISLTEEQQKTYDGFSTIKVKGVDIPTVTDCTKVSQDADGKLNNKLVYCKTNKKIYRLKAKTGSEFYDTELVYKENVNSVANLIINNNRTEPIKLGEIFKKIGSTEENLDNSKHSLNLDSVIQLNVEVTGVAPIVKEHNIEPDFEDTTVTAKDIEADYIKSVIVSGVQVKNWENYTKFPENPTNGEKYYFKPDDNHTVGTEITIDNVTWKIGNTYQWDEEWKEVKPLISYDSGEEYQTNSGSGYKKITAPDGYGMSEVRFKVNVQKPNAVLNDIYNSEKNAFRPGHTSSEIKIQDKKSESDLKTYDGLNNIWVEGVKVVNLDNVPGIVKEFKPGDLICVDDVIYINNGTKFVPYVIDYEHKDANGDFINLIEGLNPIVIPNSQVAKKVIVNVKSSELYDVDKTYNTTPIQLKHKGETLTPKTGTVGFQIVTLPDVTILDEPNAVEDGDANGYEEDAYVCEPETSKVFRVVDGKFKNVILDEYNYAQNSTNYLSPGEEKTISTPDGYDGIKKVRVKARELNLLEKTFVSTHEMQTIDKFIDEDGTQKDGFGKIIINPQNVINVDNVDDFYYITPKSNPDFDFENKMFYLTTDRNKTVSGVDTLYSKGVYKYYKIYDEDGRETMYAYNVSYFVERDNSGALSSIHAQLSQNPNKMQNLTFTTQIQCLNKEQEIANIDITYKNCNFEINGTTWILTSENTPTYTDSVGDLTATEINEKIKTVPGFSLTGLNIEFLQNENMTDLVWDAEGTTIWNSVNKKWEHSTTEFDYDNYYIISNTSLTDPNSNFSGDFDFFEFSQKNKTEYGTNTLIAEDWFLLKPKDYKINDLYTYETTITKNGTYTFPENPGRDYYKQFKFTTNITTGTVRDVTTLEGVSAKINDVVYLTTDCTINNVSYYKGLYKQIRNANGLLEWVRLADELISKEVVSNTIEQRIESGLDDNNNYIAIKDVYVPAYYIKTWTDGDNGPTYNDIKDTTTGRYYFMPKGAAKNETFSVTIPTSSGAFTSMPWYSGNIYQYEIDETKNITWKKVELIEKSEHTCPIPIVDELPNPPSDYDDYKVGKRFLLSKDWKIYELTLITDLSYTWKELIVEPDAPEYGYIIQDIKYNGQYIGYENSEAPLEKVSIRAKIPEVSVYYAPTSQEVITIDPSTLANNTYNHTFRENEENAVKSTYENVLIKSIKIDTTGIEFNPDVPSVNNLPTKFDGYYVGEYIFVKNENKIYQMDWVNEYVPAQGYVWKELMVKPEATKNIYQNGESDVLNYAKVNVSIEEKYGDYQIVQIEPTGTPIFVMNIKDTPIHKIKFKFVTKYDDNVNAFDVPNLDLVMLNISLNKLDKVYLGNAKISYTDTLLNTETVSIYLDSDYNMYIKNTSGFIESEVEEILYQYIEK